MKKILIYNTWDVHRLLYWAKTLDKSFELEEALFNAYFCLGTDLSVEKNILDLCQKIGLDPNIAQNVINSNDYRENVIKDIEISESIGVRGLPHFVVGKNITFSGYRSIGEFETILSNAMSKIKNDLDTSDGKSCSTDGIC